MGLAHFQKKMQIKGRHGLLSQTSLASLESLSIPLVQKTVISGDMRSGDCQKRIAGVISRMNEMESVVVNVLEKNVTITCRYHPRTIWRHAGELVTTCQKSFGKFSLVKQMIGLSSCRPCLWC